MNAKELILKKINADTNWVDIYTSGVILGEDINAIGSFMTSSIINDLVSKYNTSAFDTEYVGTKIDFIRKAIVSETDSNKITAYNELLQRVYIAEELRIMGKILKINQGMPTNSLDLQQYIESIEQYVESRLNHVNLENYYELRREREKLLRDYNLTYEEYKNYKKAYNVLFELNKLYKESNPNENMYAYKFINILKDRIKNDGLDSEVIQQYEFIINQFSHLSYNEFNILYDNIQIISGTAKREFEAKQTLYNNWQYFNLLDFVLNEDYANEMDARYEENKVMFNILNTLKNSPHFNEMFKVIGLNETILTVLSKRNAIEKRVWNRAMHKYEDIGIKQAGLSKNEMSKLKQNIDDTLADTWIKTNIRNSDGSPVRIIWTANKKSNVVTFDGGFDYKLFIKYIETELIPRLRNNLLVVNGQTIETANNAFIKHLTFGKDRDGNTIFRLPYNMSQIDKNPGIQVEYEKILNAFGQLRGIILDNGLSVVDMFYLYNLIVHKDKFSRSALTRLFEDLIASDGGEQLLVFKFNEWLETVNEEEIINKVLGDWGAIHSNGNIITKTNNENDGNRRIILERAKEEFAKLQNMPKSIDINTISTKTEAFGVVFPKQGKTSQALKSEYQQWQTDNPTGIVAYRVKFPYNTVEEAQLGHIGNPFSENARGANTVQQFYDWLVTGNSFGNEKATDEYRHAIISKLLSTPANSPILYYTELNRPSHATVLGYLIANKQLLSNQLSPRVEIYQGYWTRKEVESQTDKVFLFGDNTDDRVNTHYIPTRTQAIIRGLPNAIGIDTKKNRGTSESSYFTDADFDIFKAQVDEAIQRAIDSGKTIVIPADGIGTGKAELEKRAPKLFAYLQQQLDELKNLNSVSPIQFDDSIDISEESVAEEPVTIGFDNTSDRISEEPNESNYIEPIRRLQLLDDYYRPIFTSEELISFEEDAKRIFVNKSILNERVNIHYSEWKSLDDITDMRRWEKIWEDIVYDGNAEESENDFKYNNKSKTVQIPKYIYDRIKLYQKYQKLVDFLMRIAQKNNYYDYYGNLLRHDEDWFGDIGGASLDILKDLYDLAGIKEIYDDPNQLKLFDSLHIDSDYIAEREEILRNATRNLNQTPVYKTTPSKQSKLIEVVRQAREKGIKGLHAVSQSDLINEDIYIRSAFGFVRNGEIYINVDRAGDDTVIHEFGHLYLADAKNNNRLAYYALLEKVKDTALWKEMRKWAAYANKIGSDFDEEILATMIGDYYKAGFENYEYESLVKEALELVDPEFIELLNSEILPDLGDTFITNYYFQQKVSTWKSKLVSDNILKENCL